MTPSRVPSDRAYAFGRRLRKLRLGACLSQRELSARCGLTSGTISWIERGQSEHPRHETVQALADALGVDTSALTGAEAKRDAHAVR